MSRQMALLRLAALLAIAWGTLLTGSPGAAELAKPSQAPLLADCGPYLEEVVFPSATVPKLRGRTVVGGPASESSSESAPLAGVQVEIKGRDLALYVLSAADGGFSFPDLPSGSYELRTCYPGFDVLSVRVEVDPEAESRLAILQLAPSESGATADLRWVP